MFHTIVAGIIFGIMMGVGILNNNYPAIKGDHPVIEGGPGTYPAPEHTDM